MNVDRVLAWLERKNFISVHALTLYITLALTWVSLEKMTAYALASRLDGTGTALVIAAITAPIAYLQKAVFEIYAESRK